MSDETNPREKILIGVVSGLAKCCKADRNTAKRHCDIFISTIRGIEIDWETANSGVAWDSKRRSQTLLFASFGQRHRYLTRVMRVVKKNMSKKARTRDRAEERSINRFQPVFIGAAFYKTLQRLESS